MLIPVGQKYSFSALLNSFPHLFFVFCFLSLLIEGSLDTAFTYYFYIYRV